MIRLLVVFFVFSLPAMGRGHADTQDGRESARVLVTGQEVAGNEKLPTGVTLFRDNHNTFADDEREQKKRLPEGWILEFKVKFDEASVMEGTDNAFLEGKNRKVYNYHWPKDDRQGFTEGRYVDGKEIQFSKRKPPIPGIMADLNVTGSTNKPPKTFPLVQINYSQTTTEEIKDDAGKHHEPRRYRHNLRINFAGGFIDVVVVNGHKNHVWEADDIVKAFGRDRVRIFHPN